MHEFDIISQYFNNIVTPDKDILCAPGDDAAVIAIDKERSLLISTDTSIINVHFPAQTPAFAIGYKSLAVNLSDLAAMGAQPRWCTLAITLPEEYRQDNWLRDFHNGFRTLADTYAVSLIGGDTCSGEELSITIQIMGTAINEQIVYRSGAKPGQGIYVGGELGTAAFALAQLKAGRQPEQSVIDSLNQPEPQVQLGMRLCGRANAMIDISDGLIADLSHILTASQAGAIVNLSKIPLNSMLCESTDRAVIYEYALSGGDDYKLCFTSALSESQLVNELAIPVYRIGEVVTGTQIDVVDDNGRVLQLEDTGYLHV